MNSELQVIRSRIKTLSKKTIMWKEYGESVNNGITRYNWSDVRKREWSHRQVQTKNKVFTYRSFTFHEIHQFSFCFIPKSQEDGKAKIKLFHLSDLSFEKS